MAHPPRRSLGREISVVLAVKLILLAGLWFAFFRHPPPQSDVAVSRHVLSTDPAQLEGVHHDFGHSR